jgi:hypothetical protein
MFHDAPPCWAFWPVTRPFVQPEPRKTTPAALLIKGGSACAEIAAPHAGDFTDGNRLCEIESLRRIMARSILND